MPSELEGFFCSIRRLNDNGFCLGIDLGDRSRHGVLQTEGRQRGCDYGQT
jgi:hypothetical protein